MIENPSQRNSYFVMNEQRQLNYIDTVMFRNRLIQGVSGKNYILNKLLNQGSFGYIYDANTTDGSEQEYAVKILKNETEGYREIQILTWIKENRFEGFSEIIDYGILNPQVAKYFDVAPGTKFIVIKKLEANME